MLVIPTMGGHNPMVVVQRVRGVGFVPLAARTAGTRFFGRKVAIKWRQENRAHRGLFKRLAAQMGTDEASIRRALRRDEGSRHPAKGGRRSGRGSARSGRS